MPKLNLRKLAVNGNKKSPRGGTSLKASISAPACVPTKSVKKCIKRVLPGTKRRVDLSRKNKVGSSGTSQYLSKEDKEVIGEVMSPHLRDSYPVAKCMFHDSEGKRCRNYAVGKSSLCQKHGGDPVIRENLLTDEEILSSSLVTKYNPLIHPIKYLELSREGKSPTEIASEFSVSLGTLKNWSEKYASFNTVYEIGASMYEAWWLSEGKGNLNNSRYNTSLFKFLTGNTLGYSDKVESRNFNQSLCGVMLLPPPVPVDEWEKKAQKIIHPSDNVQQSK